MAKSKHCARSSCDTRKLKRSAKADKVEKDSNRKIIIEYLGYVCFCGAKWRQKIDYRSGRRAITWIKTE